MPSSAQAEFSSCAAAAEQGQKHSYCDNCLRLSCTFAAPDRLMKCSSCKDVSYCDRDCQKKDWKHHKQYCKSLAAGDLANEAGYDAARLERVRQKQMSIQQDNAAGIPAALNKLVEVHDGLIHQILIEAIYKPGLDVMNNYVILMTRYLRPNEESHPGYRFPVYDGWVKSRSQALDFVKNDIGMGRSPDLAARAENAAKIQDEQAAKLRKEKSKLLPPAIIFWVVAHRFPGPMMFLKTIISGTNKPEDVKWNTLKKEPSPSSNVESEKVGWLQLAKNSTCRQELADSVKSKLKEPGDYAILSTTPGPVPLSEIDQENLLSMRS